MAPKEQKTIGSKIKEMSTMIGAVCAVTSILWLGFREYNSYNSQKEDYPLLKQTVEKQKKQIDSLNFIVGRLNAENISDVIQIELSHEILAAEMEDYIYDGIRFKKSYSGKLYYYNSGILYSVTWDQVAYKYYYIGGNGKSYWCR